MTWLQRARFEIARWLPCALALIPLSCAAPQLAGPTSAAAMPTRCPDLIAKALVSTDPVSGSWACLTPNAQQLANGHGSPASDAFLAGPSPFANPRLVYEVKVPLGYVTVYVLDIPPSVVSGPDGKHATLTVWLDTHGQVMNFGYAVPLL